MTRARTTNRLPSLRQAAVSGAMARRQFFGGNARTVGGATAGGTRIGTPFDPPSFNSVPWYTQTIAGKVTFSGSVVIRVSDIKTTMNNQLGFTGDFNFRLKRVKTWLLVQDPTITYALSPYDLANFNPRAEYVDLAGRNHWATLGYAWPIGDQAISKYTSTQGSDQILQLTTNAPAAVEVILYFDVLWRFETFVDPVRTMSANGMVSLIPRAPTVVAGLHSIALPTGNGVKQPQVSGLTLVDQEPPDSGQELS